MGFQKIHGRDDLPVGALAAARVGGLLEALRADSGHEILDAEHLAAERLVYQRSVRER